MCEIYFPNASDLFLYTLWSSFEFSSLPINMNSAKLRIDPAKNCLFVGKFLDEKKTTVEELKALPYALTTLVIQSKETAQKKRRTSLGFLKKLLRKREKRIDIHELFFLEACKTIREIWVVDPYADLDDVLKHPILINNTDSFSFASFTQKVCDFLIVHKRVRHLSIGEVRAPGLATVVKANPSLEYLFIRYQLLAIDVLSFVELLFATKHKPCVIDCMRCSDSREICSFLRHKGFVLETSFDSEDHTIIRATHLKHADYFVEIAFRRTLTIYALRTAEVIKTRH
ncbi:hypothetical protein QR680_018173 [Steinernema hermaphroditum]|uniref:Uncharacterized protein n=1 Tax=Steinernema hermaphroditum TaxID=289476 RepID=A0AA39HH41_9BILA|nr:hypothetical protein QR680_018173 [Steinernema hermaphroditum]